MILSWTARCISDEAVSFPLPPSIIKRFCPLSVYNIRDILYLSPCSFEALIRIPGDIQMVTRCRGRIPKEAHTSLWVVMATRYYRVLITVATPIKIPTVSAYTRTPTRLSPDWDPRAAPDKVALLISTLCTLSG